MEYKKETYDLVLGMAETTYINMMKKKPNLKDLTGFLLIQVIFPKYWRSSSNYDLKMKLLSDAIKNKKSLMEFSEITVFEEGVITEKDS